MQADAMSHNPRRDSDGGRIGWNIINHHRIGSDPGSIADGDRADNLRSGTEEHVVANHGRLSSLRADCHLMFDHHPRATPDCTIDHDAIGVNQHKSRSKLGTAADNAMAEYDDQLVENHLERNERMRGLTTASAGKESWPRFHQSKVF